MTALEAQFWAALRRLEEWHAPATKAQSFDGPSISSTKPGATMLKVQAYPFKSYWSNRWRLAKNDQQRSQVVEELGSEYNRLGKTRKLEMNAIQALSQARWWLLESGSYYGVQYRQAAAELEVEPTTVWKWRKDRGVNPHNGRPK